MQNHLAQFNVGRLRAPLDDPRLADFVRLTPEINALADAAPGFVWRLTDEAGDDATSLRPLGDDTIVNLSVWRTVEDLVAYAFRSPHLDSLRRRREWFLPSQQPTLVLWWIPAGHVPTLTEAIDRLELLRDRGPGPDAFTPRQTYPVVDRSVGMPGA